LTNSDRNTKEKIRKGSKVSRLSKKGERKKKNAVWPFLFHLLSKGKGGGKKKKKGA